MHRVVCSGRRGCAWNGKSGTARTPASPPLAAKMGRGSVSVASVALWALLAVSLAFLDCHLGEAFGDPLRNSSEWLSPVVLVLELADSVEDGLGEEVGEAACGGPEVAELVGGSDAGCFVLR